MESNLSDLSLVSPSVAAAALREQDDSSMLNTKWAPTPTGSVVDRIMNNIDEQFNTFSKNIPLPSRRGGANAAAPVSASHDRYAVDPANGAAEADSDSDCASNASTMQLLEGCRPNEIGGLDSDSPTGLPDEVANQVNAQYQEIMRSKPAHRRKGGETDSVRTEDFASKFRQITVPSSANRAFQMQPEMSSKAAPLHDASNRIYPPPNLSNTLPRTAQQSASFSPNRQPFTASASNATRAGPLRASPISAKPLEQTLFKPTMMNGASTNGAGALSRATDRHSNGALPHELGQGAQLTASALSTPSFRNATPSFGTFARAAPAPVNGSMNQDVAPYANGHAHKAASHTMPMLMRDSTMERLQTKIAELEELNREVRMLRGEKQRFADEVERMNTLLKQQQLDIRNFDTFRATARTRADGAKNDYYVMQQKRDATASELQLLNADLAQRKDKLVQLEGSARRRVEEIRQFESLGVTKQEIDALVAQRNQLFELVSQLEKDEAEKYEVQKKQLEQTSQDRFKDQRLQEQYAQLSAQMQQMIKENAALKSEIERLREEAAGVKRDRDSFLEQAATQYKQRVHREVTEVQQQSANEIAALREELYNTTERTKQLQRELERRNSAVQEKQRLQEQVEKVKANDADEMSRFYENVQKQSGDALRNLQHRMVEERDEALRSHDARFKAEIEKYRQALLEKDKECMVLRDKLRYIESTCEQLSSRLNPVNVRTSAAQTGAYDELIKDALESEKRKWREEQERALTSAHSELHNTKLEREKTIKGLNEEMQRLNSKLDEREAELRNANSELDKERLQRSQMAAEKHRELTKVREECRQTLQSELEKMRAQAQQATQSESSRYKSQCSELQKKLEESSARENELIGMLTRFVRPTLNEIEGELRQISSMLGLEQQTLNAPNSRQASLNSLCDTLRSSLTFAGDAIKNIHNALEEYNRDVEQMKEDLENYEKQKVEEFEQVRQQLEAEGQRKIEELREKMMRDYTENIRRVSVNSAKSSEMGDSMSREHQSRWKQETAEKIATQLQNEFRNELELRTAELQQTLSERETQLEQLLDERADLQERAKSQKVVVDESAAKTVKQMHAQLKQLRDENLDLHKAVSTSRKTGGSQQNLYEESDLESAAKGVGVTFARRPGSPARPASSIERNGNERRSLPNDFAADRSRFSPISAANNAALPNAFEPPQSAASLNRTSSPFNVPASFFSSASPQPSFVAQSSLQYPRAPALNMPASASAMQSSEPLFRAAPATNGNGSSSAAQNGAPYGRDYSQPQPYAPMYAGAAEDLQTQVNDAAKNKTLRQIDKDYLNLQAKLQRPPPTFRSLNSALNGSAFGSPATLANGNSMSNRASPLARPLSRMLPKAADGYSRPTTFYETSM